MTKLLHSRSCFLSSHDERTWLTVLWLGSWITGGLRLGCAASTGEGDFFANHNHHELSRRAAKAQGKLGDVLLTPAMASGLTDHVWSIQDLLSYRVAPLPWVEPKRRGRPAKQTERHVTKQQPLGEQPRRRPLLRLRKGVLCSTTS